MEPLEHTRLTLALLFILLLVLAENLARTALSIKQAIDIPNLPTSLSPIYVAISGAAWAVGFAACLFGIARLNPWAPKFTTVVSVLYELNLWLNRLVFSRSSEALTTTGFRLVLSLLFLGAVIGALVWPSTRRLFIEARRYLEALKREA